MPPAPVVRAETSSEPAQLRPQHAPHFHPGHGPGSRSRGPANSSEAGVFQFYRQRQPQFTVLARRLARLRLPTSHPVRWPPQRSARAQKLRRMLRSNAQSPPPRRILTEDLRWRNAIAAETNTIRLSRFGTRGKRARSIHSSARFTCSPQSAQNAGLRSLAMGWKVMKKFSAAPIARNVPASPRSKIALDRGQIDR